MEIIGRVAMIMVGYSITIGFGILILIKGWGLTPVSYWWIIGVGIIANFVGVLFVQIALHSKKPKKKSRVSLLWRNDSDEWTWIMEVFDGKKYTLYKNNRVVGVYTSKRDLLAGFHK